MNLTFGTPSTENPRPFKCSDCMIAFRIHGHLAKHLRSKMHIMKLECLGKLPFGTYAEMERSGISLNEIDTTDCHNSLESLQSLAHRLYKQDPSKLQQWQHEVHPFHPFFFKSIFIHFIHPFQPFVSLFGYATNGIGSIKASIHGWIDGF